jgi:hypothetical protein
MPSLEIICIDQPEPSDFSHLPFRVKAEKELVSHRSPKPLFQADFDRLAGCIYHLLDDGPTAYDLLVRDWYDDEGNSNGLDDNVEFMDEYASPVKEMLEQLLQASPVGQVLFTTDYQFGPKGIEKHGPMSLMEFWDLHEVGKVQMNSSYLITAQ